jgi:hypothetical protein
MHRERVGEDRGGKETDGCPLTVSDFSCSVLHSRLTVSVGPRFLCATPARLLAFLVGWRC